MKKDVLHVKSPENWINDPNGFIYYQGNYHLFYQYFPYAPEWGTMHWGHAVSKDLIHWEHLGIALFPTKPYDQNGVFSGSALEKDGKLYLYYSAVRYLKTKEENIHLAQEGCHETSQAMIISEDGFSFENWKNKKQILPVIRDENIADPTDTRDPKVWKENNTYYMVLGSTLSHEMGRAVFFDSKDGITWTYKNQRASKDFGTILECPDIFSVSDTYVFVGSMINKEKDGYKNHSLCALAEFEAESGRLDITGDYQYVDYGKDLYAPQTNLDQDGRRVMIGWMRMPKPVYSPGEKPWNGMMSIPRVVEVEKGHIYFRVHPAAEQYFSCRNLNGEFNELKPVCRLQAVLQEGEEINLGGYRIWMEENCVKTDRSQVMEGISEDFLYSSTPKLSGKCELDIFVDPNLIEIFINHGEYVISNIVYGLSEKLEGNLTAVYLPNE